MTVKAVLANPKVHVLRSQSRLNDDIVSKQLVDGMNLAVSSNAKEFSDGFLNKKRGRGKKKERWQPIGADMISGGDEIFPDAINKYAQFKQPPKENALMVEVRKQLCHLGWKIEYNTDQFNVVRFRYTSPDDSQRYLSLWKLCRDLKGLTRENCSVISKEFRSASDSRKRKNLGNKARLSNRDEKGKRTQKLKRRKVVEVAMELRDGLKRNQPTRLLRSSKRVGQKVAPISLIEYSMKPAKDETRDQPTCLTKSSKRKDVNCNQRARVLKTSKRIEEKVIDSDTNRLPRTSLSCLIERKIVFPGARIYYRGRRGHPPLAKGQITPDGIKCNCCHSIFNPRGFEVHAGSKYRSASVYIVLEDDGRSLLDCQRQMLQRTEIRKAIEDGGKSGNWHQGENDDICSVCYSGGKLVLCDGCPSSFHKTCLGFKSMPKGDWFCSSCCCGICGQRFAGEILQSMENVLMRCHQCQHKYHPLCLRSTGDANLESCQCQDDWFCSKKCKKIFLGLHKLSGKQIHLRVKNLTWTLLKPTEPDCENNSKLKVALDVMHECFEPVKDDHNGRDIVEDMIFNQQSDLNRLNFRGFYTFLLERNIEVISVANVRIYGNVAELPLIATRSPFRGLGMCHILMDVIERQLMKLGVERLILLSVPTMLNTWTNSFGFSKMTNFERLQHLDYTFLSFPNTILLQKLLVSETTRSTRT